MAFTGRIVFSVSGSLTSSPDLERPVSTLEYKKTFEITNGTGANQANKMFSDTRTLVASATEDLDLSGSLTDAFGVSLVFTRIIAFIITASSANTNLVNVICPVANGFITPFAAASDTVKVRPGGMIPFIAPDATGYVVTAGTGDLITITNSAGGTSVTYDVIIIGS